MNDLILRTESPADVPAIHAVHATAFPTDAEAVLVDSLRDAGAHILSLVALKSDLVAGHVLFTPVRIESENRTVEAVGLAPVGVLPGHQRAGVGGRLIREGLDRLREAGHEIVALLGHADYYPRFGFARSDRHGITCEFPSAPESFMVLELRPGALREVSGMVRYHPLFQSV